MDAKAAASLADAIAARLAQAEGQARALAREMGILREQLTRLRLGEAPAIVEAVLLKEGIASYGKSRHPGPRPGAKDGVGVPRRQ